MTEQRNHIGEIINEGLGVDPLERAAGRHEGCSESIKLLVEAGAPLTPIETAGRDEGISQQGGALDETGSWPGPSACLSPHKTAPMFDIDAGASANFIQIGQYRIHRRIGAGGMGEVYLAEHQFLKRFCALKLVRPDSAADPKALARFEREVRATAALSHPNTVEIYDYGRTADGIYYYVMEFLPGLSLAELVERHGPLSPGRVVYLLRQICQALCEAHAEGLIHRDIKPSNIVAARRGGIDDVAKLLDFGLVRPVVSEADRDTSGEGRVVGTPLYTSPEQARGDRGLDGRSDIYSLGAVAYHLLTGRPPFNKANGLAILVAHTREPLIPPSLIRADIPKDLERVVVRCLAKDAADRFANAASLDRALGACACAANWDQYRAAHWWRETGQDFLSL
jgi:eukaryotic-like serine/threonine-protein kinase